jgi:hypothetical protein
MERGPAETAPHTGSPIDEVEAVFDEVRLLTSRPL